MICDSAMLDWEVKEKKKKEKKLAEHVGPPVLVEPVLSARPGLCSRQLCRPDYSWRFYCACCTRCSAALVSSVKARNVKFRTKASIRVVGSPS
jgi:hypothetical protein